MGRSAAQIKDFIISKIGQKTNLSVMAASVDPDAIWKQFVECVANVLASHEAVADQHILNIEGVADFSNPHTATWVRERVLEFQYDADVPQILIDVSGVVQYPVIDVNKRIVSNCAVRTTSSRITTVLAAKNDPPEILADEEKKSISGYLNNVLSPSFNLCGVVTTVTSLNPDYCFIEAEVKYDGLYASTIDLNVTNAIKYYLKNLGITGSLSPYALYKSVRSVPGVKDFIIKNLAIRANATAFGSADYLVTAFTDNLISPFLTTAGYCYTEVEPGEDLATKLTFTRV